MHSVESECPRKALYDSDNDLFYVYLQTAVMTSRSIVEVSFLDNYNFFPQNIEHLSLITKIHNWVFKLQLTIFAIFLIK